MRSRPEQSLRVFVSYTGTDLEAHAKAVEDGAKLAEDVSVQFKSWAEAGSDVVETCLAKVGSCDVVIVLVAHRYGWVPDAEARPENGRVHADGKRSMVWLEVAEAERLKKLVIPLLVETEHGWNPEWIDGRGDKPRHDALNEFRAHLQKPSERARWVARFTDPGSVIHQVKDLLRRAKSELTDPVARYRSAVREKCGRVDLIGFGHDREVHLSIEEVYVPIRLSPRFRSGGSDAELAKARGPRAHEREDAAIDLEAVPREAGSASGAAALLGVPGCGKSTALRRLAWECAQPERLAGLGLPPETVPVLLRLRTLPAGALPTDWWRFVRAELKSWLELDLPTGNWLEERPILWLLDGLDEIASESQRADLLAWVLKTLATRLEKRGDRLVVSSREGGWPANEELTGRFLELNVDLLDEPKRQEFVRCWYAEVLRSLEGDHASVREKAAARAEELNAILDEGDFRGRLLSQVVANPLLLSILCLMHHDQTELPRRRAALYDRCLSVLLTYWRKSKGLERLDETAAREVLKSLAWWLQAECHSAAAPAADWNERARMVLTSLSQNTKLGRDGEALMRRLVDEAGVIQDASAGQRTFLHLTLQEHLAGRYAVDEGKAEEIAAHFGDERWNEVIRLALSGAPRSFTARFFAALLSGEGWRVHLSLLDLALEESLHVPLESFHAAFEEASAEDRRALAQLVRTRTGLELPEPRQPRGFKGVIVPGPILARLPPKQGEERQVQPAGITLVYIPPGEFGMGSDKGDADERPIHRVQIAAGFWLAKHPVTNAEYARFLEATKAKPPEYWTNAKYNQPSQPVVGVSWDEAKAYCAWAGLELPSEAQWEYACRGSTGPTKTEYWFGDDVDGLKDAGWFDGNSGGQLQAVTQKRPNPFGLFDVHGNVWEWCEDRWHSSYEGAPKKDEAWVEGASGARVFRGGSFGSSARGARSAYRDWYHASDRGYDLGFRPAQAVTP
jgi:formylglycine-generating enzyme required for sulfatase activity